MSNRSETFGRLLKGAINSIAAYEGKTAPAVEEDLGAQIGLAGSALQRYKAGNLPPDTRTVEVLAAAAVRRAFLGRAWLQVFLHATRYPQPDSLIARLIGEAPASAPAGAAPPSGTVTFLFTDIVGSTRLWEEQAGAMQRALARHDAILRQAIAAHGGHVFKTVGDAFCAAFATAPAAVDAALALQRHILFEPWSSCGLEAPLLVRAVLHTGAAEERDGDYFGPPLNRVARLCAVGHGGQVLLSLAAVELARDQLPAGAALRDLGEQRMKDLARPERIFQLLAPDLPADFPPLRTLNAYRHNLPAQPTALIGREREVEDICELLRAPDLRLLTLSGPGGTGKTRLALQAAGELVDAFADGAWFVGLAPISDPALVASAIAAVFGLREQGERPIDAVLRDYLREKELLLLLDNFEQVAPAATLVAELLAAAPKLTVLVTSRVVLRLYGEREYAVPPLSLPERTPPPTFERVTQYEAVRLFIERARAVRADFAVTAANAPLIAEICHRLDGLPLAIELAAARSKLFAPQAILSRLDRRLATLTGGAQNLPARQQTLRGAIDWSYDLLDAAERECFARLGVFVGGCTLESAEAVLAAGGDLLVEPLDMLTSLVDKSLLTQSEGPDGEPRFLMLETIREYALERLEAGGSAQGVRRAHAEHFLGGVAAREVTLKGAEQRVALAATDREIENIQVAWDWAIGAGAMALLAPAISSLSLAYEWLGRSEVGLAAMRRALKAIGDRAPAEIHSQLLTAQARFSFLHGDRSEALVLLEQAETLLNAGGAAVDMARAQVYLQLGHCWVRNDYEAAHTAYSRSFALFEAGGDQWGAAMALAGLGVAASLMRSNYEEARHFLEQSVARFRAMGEQIGLSEALLSLSVSIRYLGDLPRSLFLSREAHTLAQASSNLGLIAQAASNLGAALFWSGANEEACTVLSSALALTLELGYQAELPNNYYRLGTATMFLGRYEEAREIYTTGLAAAQRVENPAEACYILCSLSWTAVAVGAYQSALHLAEEAIASSKRLGEGWNRLSAFGASALSARGLGDEARARADVIAGLRFVLETRSLVEWNLWAAAMLLSDNHEIERAAAVIALTEQVHPIHNAWSEDIGLRELRASLSTLSPDALAAAQARWEHHDFWAGVRELVDELEAEGWSAAA